MIHRSVRAAALGAASISALGMSLAAIAASPALAQDAAAAAASDRVVVTGSRIARRDFQANSPIVTVDESTFENRSSFSVEAALNQLPQFTPAGTQNLASSAGTPFPSGQAAPGAATLNLRSLGANRSLVLVNGRRPQPVNAQLLVDVNTIPSAAIQNVEVVTGGAAAVYGADAIAGVVNFILKDDFEGLEVDAQYGLTEQGDNETSQISVLVGGNFADGRGNAMIGASWSQRGRVFSRDHEFYTRGWNDPGTAAGGIGNTGITQAIVGGVAYGVNPNGTLFRVNQPFTTTPTTPPGLPAGTVTNFQWPLNADEGGAGFKLNPGGTGAGALGYNDPESQLSIPLTRYSMFGSAHYDVTDSLTFFLETSYTHSFASAQSLVPPAFNVWGLTIPYNQANDDPDSPTFGAVRNNWHPVSRPLADLLNARAAVGGVPGTAQPWTLNRGLDFLGRLRTDTTSEIYQITAGFEGTLPFRDWTWEAYGSHGNTNLTAFQPEGSISQENLQQIINGTTTTGARLVSNGAWSAGWNNGGELATQSGCTSGIGLFNADGSVPQRVVVSQDCINYSTLKLNSQTQLETNIVEATAQGGILDIWAGEVRGAVGATYREADFLFNPDSGLSSQQARANVINLIALPQYTTGYINVKEIYGELAVPLLSDLPFIQQLDLEVGGRYSDYNTAGGIWTYKVLGDWAVNDWLRFRGGYQLANRAPNIYELFAPIGSSISGNTDPCLNTAQSPAWGNVTGNPNRVNLQLACAELIRRDGGFSYTTLATNPNPGQPASGYTGTAPNANLDTTHMSNFRWTVPGYNAVFGFNLALEQGNRNLDSEEADTWTAGVVISSPFDHPLFDRMNLSVDWYSIDLQGTIAFPSGATVYSQCLNPQFNPSIAAAAGTLTGAQILAGNQYCALINRENVDINGVIGAVGSGLDRNFDAAYLNQGGTKTSGIDIQTNWGADFADLGLGFIPGSFNWNVQASILLDFKESPFPGAPFVDYKGTVVNSSYDYRVLSTFNWLVGDYSIGLRTRYLPDIDPAPTAALGTQGANNHTEWDLFGRWMISDQYELRGGIDNLLDEQPEVVGRTPTNNALNVTNGNYDIFGRRFYLGFTARY